MNSNNESVAAEPLRTSYIQHDFWGELKDSLKNPEFWALSSWLDIIVRARKSRFGIFWLMMPALVYVFGMGSFFAGMQGKTLQHFAAHIALGVMIFRALMSVVSSSSTVFNANQSFIMDGHVRLTDYQLEALAKSFFDFCMYIPITIAALVMFRDVSWFGLLMAPVSLAVIYINGLWISTVFSLLGARFPDVGQLINNITVFLFLLTPVIWYSDTMPADSVRGVLMRLNPFYHFIQIYRAPILGEPIGYLSYLYVGIMTVVGLLLATFLYRRYARFVPLWI